MYITLLYLVLHYSELDVFVLEIELEDVFPKDVTEPHIAYSAKRPNHASYLFCNGLRFNR